MVEFNKEYFMGVIAEAKELKVGIEVWVSHPDVEDPEIIMNSYNNLDYKEAYYDEAYNEDMSLKAFPEIRIININHLH